MKLPPIRLILALTTALSIVSTHSSAFQSASPSPRTINILTNTGGTKAALLHTMTKQIQHSPVLRLRGGASDTDTKIAAAAAASPKKKIRIAAFDSMRFFLILNIVLGHFGRFANPSDKLLTAFSQHNVMVGAFFALSGYVTAYTTTELGQRVASAKFLETPKQTWILQKIFGFFPLHLAVLLLFSPLFIYADATYNGPIITAAHALISVTMTQAWMPQHAEIWNAPTWFLGALTFATACMPYCLPTIATLSQAGLVKTGFWIWLSYLLPKLGYCYDFGTWKMAEGIVAPKLHPNYAAFNAQRFSPAFAVAEVMLGVIACRIVMLDGTSPDKKKRQTNALSTIVPLMFMVGLIAARAYGLLEVSDLLFRAVAFVPLFLRFLMAAHRNTVANVRDPIISFLNNPLLLAFGGLTFPIFIVHGPVGQLFYKKLIAKKLFGDVLLGPANFGLYLLSVVSLAWVLQKAVLQNKTISNWSKNSVDKLSGWF